MTAEQNTGVVNIHGKDYYTVARRIRDFREQYPDYTIVTKIMSCAELVRVSAKIKNEAGRVLATGHAEEERGSTKINAVSALENCETGAIGRALAAFGFTSGGEFASAEEVQGAEAKVDPDQWDRILLHNRAAAKFCAEIAEMKQALSAGDYVYAYGVWKEQIPEAAQNALRIAFTKGGIFTTDEQAAMKSNEWTAARKEYHNGKDQL